MNVDITDSMMRAMVWAYNGKGYFFTRGLVTFPTQTARALEKRGLVTYAGVDAWKLTDAGLVAAKEGAT